jgi:hypothetical protein
MKIELTQEECKEKKTIKLISFGSSNFDVSISKMPANKTISRSTNENYQVIKPG